MLSTLHTTNAQETVDRIVDMYPPHHQQQARMSLANSLQGIVCQRLLPSASGGRVAAFECLVMTTRIHEFLVDPAKTNQVGGHLPDALATATSPHDFRIAVRAAGLPA